MTRWGIRSAGSIFPLFFVVAFFFSSHLLFLGRVQADDKTPEKLQADFDHESNPKKRVKIAIDLSDYRLKELREAYESEDPAREAAQLENYMSAIEHLETAVSTPGAGTSKDAEIHLRRQTKILENIRMGASYSERGPVEKATDRVAKLHEHVLYSIMNPKK
jgi:hypothetical protein